MKIDGLGSLQPVDPKNKNDNAAKTDKQTATDSFADLVELAATEGSVNSAGYTDIKPAGTDELKSSSARLDRISHYLQSGYYDRQNIRERLSEKVIVSTDFGGIVSEYKQAGNTGNITGDTVEVRHSKIAEVQKMIDEDFYNNPASFGMFDDRIIDYFGV